MLNAKQPAKEYVRKANCKFAKLTCVKTFFLSCLFVKLILTVHSTHVIEIEVWGPPSVALYLLLCCSLKSKCCSSFLTTEGIFFECCRQGVNFINILRAAFAPVDPESVKRYLWLNCIFYAFGIYERKSCT